MTYTLLGPEPWHSHVLPERSIGYTAFECERDMRRMTDGERGCAAPEEHEPNVWNHWLHNTEEKCPNPECPSWVTREAIGTFGTIEGADAYRLRMHDPEAYTLVRILPDDRDRDWCEEKS